tara:strand:- start:273 stop:1040 length:768 start_codon:yes stop_codon:yes gene_type:complete
MNTKETLKSLGLTPSEITVYTAMIDGKIKVKDIINVTSMQRPSVYHAMNKLQARGLVGRVQAGSYNRWQLAPASALQQLVAEKQSEVKELQSEVELLAESIDATGSTSNTTQVTFYEGQQAVEGVVFNALYCKSKEILSIAPDGNFFHQTGSDFARKFIQERMKRDIATRHLWESQGPATDADLRQYYGEHSQVRLLPKEMREAFVTTVFIYDDTVMYISSKRSGYAVVFKSVEHAELQRAIFEALWAVGSNFKT